MTSDEIYDKFPFSGKAEGKMDCAFPNSEQISGFCCPHIGGSLYPVSPNFPFVTIVVGCVILLGAILVIRKWQ